LKLVVVGIPKTIDNDIQLLDKTFGFDTAVEEAQRAINAAYVEVTRNREYDLVIMLFFCL
jgi:6-phosphofructokinase 1